MPKLGPVLVARLEELAVAEEEDNFDHRSDHPSSALRLRASHIPLLD